MENRKTMTPVVISRDEGGVLNTENTHIEKVNPLIANTLTTRTAGGDLYQHHGNLIIEVIKLSDD